jgi:RimJ/RimL family protein N-acetyltransferase
MDLVEVPTLETERLRLRSFRRRDTDDYASLRADPEVLRYLLGAGGQPWDRGRSWRHMAFLIGHWKLAGVGTWAVEHRQTGAFVGMVGYSEPEGWPGFELAWTLARHGWGHGYATEAARAALDYAFTAWKRDRVISLINPENDRSIRVAGRLGETLQGHVNLNGHEMLCYGIDREIYTAQATPALSLAHPS